MRFAGITVRNGAARSELLLLLAASLACAIVLTIAVVDAGPDVFGMVRFSHVVLVALVGGALPAVGVVAWRALGVNRRRKQSRRDEITELRRSLATAEAILQAEPQVLVYWQQGQNVKIGVHTLSTVPGLPEDPAHFLRFGQWLETGSARELKTSLDTLFTLGQPFNLLVRTTQGGHAEADGRVSGGRAVLRLRDVAGSRRDLARIMEQQQKLVRDITLSRSLFDALPMPVWIRGAEERLEWVNKAYVGAVEATDEGEVRERQIELLEMRQRSEVAAVLGRNAGYSNRLSLNVGGERKTYDVVVLPLGDASAAAAVDMTAAESVQGELDRKVEAYDRTLDRVTTAVAIFGADHRLTFYNAAYQKLWQLDADWLATGPTDGQILDRLREAQRLPQVVNYREWKSRSLASHNADIAHEDGWHLPDGRTLAVTIEARPDGGVTHLYDDATERLALESRYKIMIDVQRETLDNLQEGVAVFGTDGRLRLFNTAFERVWKLSSRTLRSEPHIDTITDQCRVLHDDARGWVNIARAVTGFSEHRQPIEGQMVRSDHSVIDFAALPLPDGGTLVTFSDVTAAKSYERALIERNEALIAADRLKSQFIGHVSYELRTPLTNIIGFAELLESPRTGTMNIKQREYLSDVSASSKTLLSIIDDILDLANMDAGALELKQAPTRIEPLIEAAVLAVRDRLTRAHHALDVKIAPDIDVFIADEARVRQVLYNLLSNAIGFSQPGGPIGLECRREGGMIVFTVVDQGVGIPKDQQRSVLERFVSRTQGSKHRGAGLGLSIAKSLVELHGGAMSLDSELGRGTAVAVRFPEHGNIARHSKDDRPTGVAQRA